MCNYYNTKTIMKPRFILSLLIVFFVANHSYSQFQTNIGGGMIYNFQTRSVGIDIRTEQVLPQVDLLEGVIIAPQIAYYPWFNNIHEFYIGSSVHVGLYSYKKWIGYGLANISYNGWINHSESAASNAKFSNLGFEMGGGITNSSCTRPFIEYRYNFKWREGNIRAGVVYTFNCSKRGMVPCPKIPRQPKLEE